jgi:AcrR family transcriptional regulator
MRRKRSSTFPAARDVPRGPGRPRSEDAHLAILRAGIALVREVGYDAVTMDGIALRAGVGKATLYRRWKSKETLIADALALIARAIPVPDTGSTRGDLVAVMRSSIAMYHDPATKGLLSGLVAAMARSSAIAEAVRSGFLAARAEVMRGVLVRGVERGDLRTDVDPHVAMDLLRGSLLVRGLLTGDRIDEPFAESAIDVVLRGLAPAARPRTPSRSRAHTQTRSR